MSNRVEAILSVRDKNFASGMAAAQASLQGIDSSMNRTMATGQRMEAIGNVMTKAVTLPLMAVGAAALKVGADFESSMNTVQARTGMAADEVDGLGNSFRDMAMSGEFGNFSARQIAEAYSQVAVRGQSAADATNLMSASMTLATATGNDLAGTSYFLGNYLLKIGKDASYADRYIDMFALAVSNTGISLTDMQNYMFRMTPAFEAFGSSAETNVAIMSRLYQAGIRGATLYSGMGGIMMDVAAGADWVAQKTDRFGIAMHDANGQARENVDVLFDIADAMYGYMDAGERAAWANENLTQVQRDALLEFVNLSTEIRGEVIPAFYAASDAYDGLGIAAQMASIEQGGLSAQVQRLRIMLEEKAKQIATHLIPAAMRLVEALGRLMQRFASLNPETQRFLVRLGAIAAAAGPVLKITGRMIQTYAKLKAGYTALKGAMVAHKAVQKAGVTKTMLQSVATGKLTASQMANFKSITANTSGVITLNAAKSKQLATEIKLAAANKKGVAAMVAKASATKAQMAATKGLTAKMKVLKAVMLANPIGLKIAAVVGLVAALGALGSALSRAGDDVNELKSRQEALRASTEDLQGRMNDSQSAFEESRSSAQLHASMVQSLTGEILTLANAQNRSATDTARMQVAIDTLNSSVDGLNLAYCNVTGSLNMTESALIATTQAMMDQARATVYQERMKEIYREIHELTNQLADAHELYADVVENGNEIIVRTSRTTSETMVEGYNEASEAVSELETALEELQGEMDAVADSATELQMTHAETTASIVDDYAQKAEAAAASAEAQMAAMDALANKYTSLASAATDMFNRINTEASLTVAEMQANLEHNQATVANWSENIAFLASEGVDQGLLNTLKKAGPESAGHVQALVQACDAELMQLSDTFADGGDIAIEALATALGVDMSVAQEAAQLAEETTQSLMDTLEAADIPGIGEGIPEGLATGISATTAAATAAAEQLAEETEQGVRGPLGSNSPSQVMMDIGEGIPEGLSMGITGNADSAVSAMEQLADMMVNALESGLDAMDNIGTTSFAGIAQSARTGMTQVVNTTRSSSSQASSALSSGLRGMGTATQSNMSAMQSTTTTGMNQVRTAITQGISQSNQAMSTGLNQMNSTTSTNMTNIQNTTRTGMTQMNSVVRSNMQTMQSTTQSAMSSFSSSVSSSMNSARSSVNSAAAGMVASLNGLSGSFFSAGLAAGHGLANGVRAGGAAAVAAAQAVANQVAAIMRSALQVSSPSRVTMEIGRFTAEGFALGMEKRIGQIRNVAEEMANAAIPRVGNDLSFAGMGSMSLGGDYTYDTTYTIVVPVEIDGREVARATAEYNQEEAEVLEDRANRRRR